MSLFYSAGLGGAIPDADLLHEIHDARSLSLSDGQSVDPWPDDENSNDLTAGTAPTFKSSIINNNPVVRFNGTDQFLDNSYSQLSEPVVWGWVWIDQDPNNSNIRGFADSQTSGEAQLQNRDGNYGMFSGTLQSGGSPDTNAHISTVRWDGANSVWRIDGTQIISADPGATAIDGLTLGSQGNQNGFHAVDIGIWGVWEGNASLTDIETYLDNQYGPIL